MGVKKKKLPFRWLEKNARCEKKLIPQSLLIQPIKKKMQRECQKVSQLGQRRKKKTVSLLVLRVASDNAW